MPASAVADLAVGMMNMRPGDLLTYPGAVVWKETTSPLAAKYGLREVKNLTGAAIRVAAGRSYGAPRPGAYQPADLPPGT